MSRPDTEGERIEAILERMESGWTPRDRIVAAVLPSLIAINPYANPPDELVGKATIELAYRWADAVLEHRNEK